VDGGRGTEEEGQAASTFNAECDVVGGLGAISGPEIMT